MAKRKPRPGFRFPGPVPAEALEFFRAKGLRPSFYYLDVAAEEHALAFTVAKSTGFDILEDVKAALDEHLAEGKTFESFRRELTPILEQKGWWGEKEVVDPQTGDKRLAQLGSPRRLKTIFRANMRSARAAGQWQRIQRTRQTHPFLLYRLGPSEEHRAEHVEWAGTLLEADDDWWQTHFPPNGWGCKCWVRQVSSREAERLGGRKAPRPPDLVEWTNPRTGLTQRVDRGLDPSWAGNPGLDRSRLLAEKLARDIDDIGALSAALAREQIARIRDSPLLERMMAESASGQNPGPLPVGYLDLAWRRALGTARRAVLLDARGAGHVRDHSGNPLAAIRDTLPPLLSQPALVVRVRDHGGKSGTSLAFFGRDASGEIWKAAVHVKRDRLRLATMHGSSLRNAEALLARDLDRSDPSKGKQAEIVSGGLGALR